MGFALKRDRVDNILLIDRAPEGTFYVWGDIARLPPRLADGLGFFRAGLEVGC